MSPTVVPTARGEFAALVAGPAHSQAPVVLLVPGWTGSKEDFLTLMPEVARAGRRVVAIDQRGQFETPGPEDPSAYTLDALAEDLRAVAASVSEKPVDLLGHSLGGLIAATASIQDPLAVNSLVMLCSGPGPLPVDRHPQLRGLERVLVESGLEAAWQVMRSHDRQVGVPAVPDDIEAWLYRRHLSGSRAAMLARTSLLRTAPPLAGRLAQVPVPVLVLSGELDDGWPVQEQATLAAETGGEHQVMPVVGHSPAVEDPAGTAARLGVFWDRWLPGRTTLTLTLGPDTADVPRARREVRRTLADYLGPGDLDDAELLTSELVSNGLVHATAPVRLRCSVRGRIVETIVSDSGPSDGSPTWPGREHHGRGLMIVDRVVRRWGWCSHPAGTSVWFWLPATQAASRSSSAQGAAAGPAA